jgi:hypothetical protein
MLKETILYKAPLSLSFTISSETRHVGLYGYVLLHNVNVTDIRFCGQYNVKHIGCPENSSMIQNNDSRKMV